MTQIELAAAVGLSQPAVAERIRKLEDGGIIEGYAAHVDARMLGKGITAFIGVGISHPRHNRGFVNKMAAQPDVLECHHVTGEYSYMLKIKTENAETLDRLISERLRTIPGVTRTHTTIAMSSVKESTRIEPPGEVKRKGVAAAGISKSLRRKGK